MKTPLLRALAAFAFLGAGTLAAPAQMVTGTVVAPDALDWPESEGMVRGYVVGEPMVVDPGGTVRPGDPIPDWIRLQSFGGIGEPRLRGYGYFVSSDDKIVIVDPGTRVVARIIDRR